jgi:hypothetical protein
MAALQGTGQSIGLPSIYERIVHVMAELGNPLVIADDSHVRPAILALISRLRHPVHRG